MLGTIPSRKIKILKNTILNLSNSGQELNTNKIHRVNYLKEAKKTISHIRIIDLFSILLKIINIKKMLTKLTGLLQIKQENGLK